MSRNIQKDQDAAKQLPPLPPGNLKFYNFSDPLTSWSLAYYVLPQTLRVEEVRKIRRKKGERWQSTAKKFSSCYFTPVILWEN